MSKEKVLTKKDCRQAAKRWLIGISTFNYETQLAPSYAFAVYPLLRKMYPNDEDFKASLNNAMKYYNTMPWISLSIPRWRSHPIHENRATKSIWTEPCNPLLSATKSTKRATSA